MLVVSFCMYVVHRGYLGLARPAGQGSTQRSTRIVQSPIPFSGRRPAFHHFRPSTHAHTYRPAESDREAFLLRCVCVCVREPFSNDCAFPLGIKRRVR